MSWARALLSIAAVSVVAAGIGGLASRAPAEVRQRPDEPGATDASLGSSFTDEQVARHGAYRRPGYVAFGLGVVVQVFVLSSSRGARGGSSSRSSKPASERGPSAPSSRAPS